MPISFNEGTIQGRVLVTGEHISRVEAEDYGKISVRIKSKTKLFTAHKQQNAPEAHSV